MVLKKRTQYLMLSYSLPISRQEIMIEYGFLKIDNNNNNNYNYYATIERPRPVRRRDGRRGRSGTKITNTLSRRRAEDVNRQDCIEIRPFFFSFP